MQDVPREGGASALAGRGGLSDARSRAATPPPNGIKLVLPLAGYRPSTSLRVACPELGEGLRANGVGVKTWGNVRSC